MSKGGKAKAKSGGLGRSLIKDRNKSRGRGKKEGGWLHTSELEDGYDWGRLNLHSVTEESRLEEFLRTAELAGTEFKAEKLNIKVVSGSRYTGLPSEQERADSKRAEEENRQYLSIPRRPQWDQTTTPEELELRERESFLEWRRSLVRLQEDDRLTLTPFEKNLEFWRQLWRVVERSDIVVQIVDARNPLLFRCEDLEKYVKEVSPQKVNMVLISKADLLTPRQRQVWADYFKKDSSVVVAFWSALLEAEEQGAGMREDLPPVEEGEGEVVRGEVVREDVEEGEGGVSGVSEADETDEIVGETASEDEREMEAETGAETGADEVEIVEGQVEPAQCGPEGECEGRLLSREELIALFREIAPSHSVITVGMVGYPNVGKSSTINTLFQGKRVAVSATPGRTKHFQTLYLTEELMLCDCPGLVFPSFLSSKAEMVCSGILPIDQLRDHTPPVSLVCQRIPRHLLEGTYGIQIPPPGEGEEEGRPPYAHELLAAYGYMRGFMTSHGQPDEPRSARYILKDYVNGKLLYCHPPPGIDEQTFNEQLQSRVKGDLKGEEQPHPLSGARPSQKMPSFDSRYFQQEQVRAVTKNSARGVVRSGEAEVGQKPWRKHNNHNKREKIRRTVPNHNVF